MVEVRDNPCGQRGVRALSASPYLHEQLRRRLNRWVHRRGT